MAKASRCPACKAVLKEVNETSIKVGSFPDKGYCHTCPECGAILDILSPRVLRLIRAYMKQLVKSRKP